MDIVKDMFTWEISEAYFGSRDTSTTREKEEERVCAVFGQ